MDYDDLYKVNPWYNDEAEAIIANPEYRKQAEAVILFLQTYLPNHFPSNHPELHVEMVMLAMFSEKNTVLAVPRSHSKTTLLSFGLAIYYIVFLEFKYIMIVSESYDKAESFVTRIRDELEYNKMLSDDFSGGKGFKTTDWAKGEIVTKTRIKVQALGYGQSGRGHVFEDTRPDLYIMDDLLTTENAGDVKLRRKFSSDIYPAIARANPKHRRMYVGTIIMDGDLLAQTLVDERWCAARYEATIEDDDGEEVMIAPMLYPREQYLEDKKAARKNGEVSIFMAEYHSNPTIFDGENTFHPEMFQGYVKKPEGFYFYYILYDPAMPPSGRTRIQAVDKSAILVIATDSDKNWWIEEIHANRATPIDNYELIFRLNKKYPIRKVFMETIAAQRSMYLNIISLMKERKIKMPLEEVPSHKGSKEARIEQLQPLYATNSIFHKENQCDELEKELLLFGNTPHDDISDALSFGINRLKYPRKSEKQVSSPMSDAYDKMFNKKPTANWKII